MIAMQEYVRNLRQQAKWLRDPRYEYAVRLTRKDQEGAAWVCWPNDDRMMVSSRVSSAGDKCIGQQISAATEDLIDADGISRRKVHLLRKEIMVHWQTNIASARIALAYDRKQTPESIRGLIEWEIVPTYLHPFYQWPRPSPVLEMLQS